MSMIVKEEAVFHRGAAKNEEGIDKGIQDMFDKLIANKPKLQKEQMVMVLNETSLERSKKLQQVIITVIN